MIDFYLNLVSGFGLIFMLIAFVSVLIFSDEDDAFQNPNAKEPKVMTKLFYESYDYVSWNKSFSEADVFRVRLFIDCEYQAGADYITDEYNDAVIELELLKERAQITDKTTDLAKLQQALYIEQLEKEQIK